MSIWDIPKGGGLVSFVADTATTNSITVKTSSDFIEKITWGLAAALFILCIVTALMVSSGGGGAGAPLLSE